MNGNARTLPTPSWSVFDRRNRTWIPSNRCTVTSPQVRATSSLRRNAPANPINNRALSRRSWTSDAQPVTACRADPRMVRMSSTSNGAREVRGRSPFAA